jgi:hypothetical protein
MTIPRAKPRRRLTRALQVELDEALIGVTRELHPITVRGAFYGAAARIPHIVTQDDQGYELVQRRLVKLRKCGHIPYDHVILLAPPDSD